MDYKLHANRLIRHILSIPFIWMMIFPLVLFDIFLEIYHRICFNLYGLGLINRWEYIRIDRQKLSYLSIPDKINCMYCGYANGLMHYGTTIAAETEKYWCGIKHKAGGNFKEPEHQRLFLEYGDAEGFKERYGKSR